MTSKVFLDTNILAYAVDRHSKAKQDTCRALLREVASEERGVISTQVLQEFFVVATRKLGLDALDAKKIMSSFENLEVVTVTPRHIGEAIDCSIINRLSFWDSLIIVCARSAACEILATEDLNDGQIVLGVRVHNPLTKKQASRKRK